MTRLARALTLVGGLLALASCRKQEPPPHRTEPWLAQPSASAPEVATTPVTWHFTPESRVRFKLSGKKGQLSGSAPVSGGSLLLDPVDLSRSRATVEVDLSGLSVDEGTAAGESSPSSPRETALQWLELGPDVDADKRAQFRFARFELTSVEGASGRRLSLSGRKTTAERVTTVGTLLLHGFRAPVRADVVLSVLAGGASPRLSIHSVSPLVLPLPPHDIGARGAQGVLDALATARGREALGSSVRLEAELTARP